LEKILDLNPITTLCEERDWDIYFDKHNLQAFIARDYIYTLLDYRRIKTTSWFNSSTILPSTTNSPKLILSLITSKIGGISSSQPIIHSILGDSEIEVHPSLSHLPARDLALDTVDSYFTINSLESTKESAVKKKRLPLCSLVC